MLDLVSHIVEKKAAHFDPTKFDDRYEDALKDLLRKKQERKPIERPERREPTNVVNLMDALRCSVEADGSRSAEAKTRQLPRGTNPRDKAKKDKVRKLIYRGTFRSPASQCLQDRTEMIAKCQVEIVDLKATYVRSAESRSAAILDGTELCGVEEFAARHFRRSGFDAILLENTPFHVLFGVYMWMLIQDPCDPRVRMIAFGDRHAYGQRVPSKLIWTEQPRDFGTAGYGRRRAKAITKHLSAISEDRVELHRLFDDWIAPSVGLRQYLWAHRQESIDRARKLIEIIPPLMLKNLLRYLVQNYWGRYSGWPDLLLYRGNQWFLAEVKSWGDKLSENQRRWIEDNHRYLHLPFKLVKVHRIETIHH